MMKIKLLKLPTVVLSLLLLTGCGFADSTLKQRVHNNDFQTTPVLTASCHDCGDLDVDTLDQTNRSFDELSKQITKLPSYQYPYHDLPSKLADRDIKSLKLFVYGSLMDYESAARTLSDSTLATRKLAKALGVKTVYNRSVPYQATPHWGQPENPIAIAMLNTIVTGNTTQDIALGVLLEVSLDDIPALLSREVGYNLLPVIIEDWEEPKKENGNVTYLHSLRGRGPFQFAYVLSAPTPGRYTDSNLLPREGYYQRVMEAARSNGETFFSLWMDNTYLADGATSIRTYELWKEEETDTMFELCEACMNF